MLVKVGEGKYINPFYVISVELLPENTQICRIFFRDSCTLASDYPLYETLKLINEGMKNG